MLYDAAAEISGRDERSMMRLSPGEGEGITRAYCR